ncbi:YCF48-related protein [Variovorax sp. Sphag1AA]|uniref:WD40/YVTN/BNR-like repeat-containing protein n=1 Tax=Variovorax sp. Sphag1AA TaxID=2587027 RepID=UPI00160CCF5A|nr:YCF48-related protein [Variovorax sp. Sphag1AA]MBB3177999.1 photosystem II stability/assembly factor-like uncharacterized protein [Variovorax sp. Sphag1AA]
MSRWSCAALVSCATLACGAAFAGAPLEGDALLVRAPSEVVLLAGARCGDALLAVGEHGVIVRSTDGGVSWQQARRVPTRVTLTGVDCADGAVGWSTGHQGTVLATVDGGLTWTAQFDGRRAAQAILAQAEAEGQEQAIAQARRLVQDGPDKPLFDVRALGPRDALVIGAYNLAFRTRDGGIHWEPLSHRLDNPRQSHLNAMAVAGRTVLIAGEQGLVLRSDDGGESFVRQVLPYQGSFFAAELLDTDTALVAGMRGQAWLTRDGGRRWTPLEGAPPVSFIAAVRHGPDTLWLLNQAGQLFAFERGAERLIALPAGVPAPATGLIAAGTRGPVHAMSARGIAALDTTTESTR